MLEVSVEATQTLNSRHDEAFYFNSHTWHYKGMKYMTPTLKHLHHFDINIYDHHIIHF